jgi:hypothetical protein
MSNNIEEYLDQLKDKLAGCDPALVQDALSDAEEHLRAAFAQTRGDKPDLPETDVFQRILDEYGAPSDVADAYRQIEVRTPPPLAGRPLPLAAGRLEGAVDDRSIWSLFFGVFVDPRAYGSLFYMMFSLITGILYFTWAITGLSLSLGFMIMIFGLPFILVFLLSIQGFALVEGRIIEALLGVRMPRRPLFSKPHLGFWNRLKALLTDKLTWTTIVYMLIQLPLGTMYFSIFITMIAFGLMGMAYPILHSAFGLPMMQIGEWVFHPPGWLQPLMVLVGILWILVTMHAAKLVGRVHAAYAKVLLVRD